MRAAIRHKTTGMYFCHEPFFVLLNRKGEVVQSMGEWCAVDRREDCTDYPNRNAAARAAKAVGITSDQWEIV